MTTVQVPDAILDSVRAAQRFLITSHRNPDGDGVGGSVGLARLLRRLGKSARVWLRDEPPTPYTPILEGERVHFGAEAPAGHPDSYDAVVVLECPSLDRTGLEEALGELTLINIDHHLGNGLYGDANWVDSAAPAVGEMVLRLAQALRLELDENSATALYLALSTDTGGFRFANATSRAFDAAAAMVRGGARPERVSEWIYESQPEAAMRLIGESLRTLELHGGGSVATTLATRSMFERCGAGEADTEGLVDYPRSIAGVRAVALLKELADGGCKVSLRSRGSIDVEAMARAHGGGGHKNAAGFTLASGPAEEHRETIATELVALVGASG
ncbi:MAG: bifunctional oligoribonuclease/PAP phosphatase NrnA [Thermoanaerobaculia bacterium]|nr:bifunctional oligoribonuclease/PAP phosphatase NrnA [Thermoanaerobaculia bacterium]